MRVVDAIAQWFESPGSRTTSGMPAGRSGPFLRRPDRQARQLEGIQAKHKSHAVHMADLYHRVSGRIAPVIVSKGPGLLNAVGACASAMRESSPVLIIAGGSTTHFLGKAGMQEIYYHGFEDATSIFSPICKGTWMLVRPDTHDRDPQLRAQDRDLGPARTGVRRSALRHPARAGRRRDRGAVRARAASSSRPRADAGNVERIARHDRARPSGPCCSPAAAWCARARCCAQAPRRRNSTFRPRRRCPPRECCRRIIRCPSARSGARVSCARRARAARPIW